MGEKVERWYNSNDSRDTAISDKASNGVPMVGVMITTPTSLGLWDSLALSSTEPFQKLGTCNRAIEKNVSGQSCPVGYYLQLIDAAMPPGL